MEGNIKILYITYTGITDHIGRSQIAPYLIGLAGRGYEITIVSAEKPENAELVDRYSTRFGRCGIQWNRVPYRRGSAILAYIGTLTRLYRVAKQRLQSETFDIVHCRGHLGSLVGRRLKRKFGTRYIFDFRDFWSDSRMETSRRFKFAYKILKWQERDLILAADGVVCLTNRAVDLLSDWYLQDEQEPRARFQVIPCCADFSLFDPRNVTPDALQRARERAGIEASNFVLIYLGSLGPDYLLHQMLLLFRQVLRKRPDARFLFISNNGYDLVKETCLELGITTEAIRFVTVDRDEVPTYISLAEFGVVFIRPALSKAGCSPTKLAEMFACNVPVIANAGVGDLDIIITPERNGSVLVPDFHEETLSEAVDNILDQQGSRPDIRANSAEFSLEAGVDRYADLYERLAHRRS